MKEATLANIKADLSKFHKIVERIANYWGDARYITLSVLLQNAAHDAVGTYEYSHERAVEKLRELHRIIKDIADYQGEAHHFERWIAEEVDSIITYADMSEDYEDLFDDGRDVYPSDL